jgi:hypothetical protein
MSPQIMIVFTLKREVHAIVHEYMDWHEEGLQVLFHSVTAKCHDAMIVMKWNKPIPERFLRKLLEDDDVSDYLIFDDLIFAVSKVLQA